MDQTERALHEIELSVAKEVTTAVGEALESTVFMCDKLTEALGNFIAWLEEAGLQPEQDRMTAVHHGRAAILTWRLARAKMMLVVEKSKES